MIWKINIYLTIILLGANLTLCASKKNEFKVNSTKSEIDFNKLNTNGNKFENVFLAFNIIANTTNLNLTNATKFYLKIERPFDESDAEMIIDRLNRTKVNNLTLDICPVKVGRNESLAIAKILKSLNLTSFTIWRPRSFDREYFSLITEALIHTKLKYLKIFHYMEIDEIYQLMIVIGRTELISLDFSYQHEWRKIHLSYLMRGLRFAPKVTELHLNLNFGYVHRPPPYWPDRYENQTFWPLFRFLHKTNISTLSLAGNSFNEYDFEHLSKILNRTKIKRLNLSNNRIFSVYQDFAAILKNSSITHLNLEENAIYEEEVDPIADVLCQTKIVDLKIKKGNNFFEKNVLEKINKCLSENRAKFGTEAEIDGEVEKIVYLPVSLDPNSYDLCFPELESYIYNVVMMREFDFDTMEIKPFDLTVQN